MFREEGFKAFYSAFAAASMCDIRLHRFAPTEGITPRVARVAPGQAVVFAVYEKMAGLIEKMKSEIAEVQETN